MASTGKGWQDELKSFLPHALDCVDPSCLRPLCVNLKLTLRHVQLCDKLEQCNICQGMKSLAVTHSNSCRDYYCRVPFCMEAKVTMQQKILMDELVKPTDADLKGEEQDNNFQIKEAAVNYGNGAISSSLMSITQKVTTPRNSRKVSGDGCPEKVPSFDQDLVWNVAKQPPSDSKVPRASPGKTIQPEWTEQSHFNPTVASGSPNSFPPAAQKPPQSLVGLSIDSERPIPSSKTTDPPKAHCQPGTKRKLLSFVSSDKSTPPSKIHRPASDVSCAQADDCPEMTIVVRKSSRGLAFKTSDAPTPIDGKNLHKNTSTSAKLLPRTPSRHVASKQNIKQDSIPTPSHPIRDVKKNPSSKSSSVMQSMQASYVTKDSAKVATLNSIYDSSSALGLQPVIQVADQNPDDSVDCYIDELFSTPPPSPTFETWFGKTVRTNDSSLKTVLLETLFQLLGVVTHPKTKQQEALFVDLLERTLRVMKTEIGKQ